MKRLIITILLVLALAFSLSLPVSAQEVQEEIQVLVDGLPVTFDVPPVVLGGRTFVPLRNLAEALNLKVDWEAATQTVYTTDGKTVIKLQINSKTAYRNNISVGLGAAPILRQRRTLVPLRCLCELYNCRVEWNGPDQPIRIISPPREMTVIGFYALGDSKTSSWTNLFDTAYPETSAGNTDIVSELALGWYSLDKDGNLLTRSRTGWQRPEGWEAVLEAAEKYNLRTEMVIHVTDGDGTISSLLRDELAMKRAADAIVEEVQLYDGVNLNFEGLGFRDEGEQLIAVQNSFTTFVALLSQRAKEAGKTITLTLHPLNSNYPGYDYKALGELADRIIIMAYDYGVKPEPLEKVVEAIELAKAQVAEAKLVLAICAKGETAESLLTKVRAAKRLDLSGIALWRLGIVTEEMWSNLRTAVETRAMAPELETVHKSTNN